MPFNSVTAPNHSPSVLFLIHSLSSTSSHSLPLSSIYLSLISFHPVPSILSPSHLLPPFYFILFHLLVHSFPFTPSNPLSPIHFSSLPSIYVSLISLLPVSLIYALPSIPSIHSFPLLRSFIPIHSLSLLSFISPIHHFESTLSHRVFPIHSLQSTASHHPLVQLTRFTEKDTWLFVH